MAETKDARNRSKQYKVGGKVKYQSTTENKDGTYDATVYVDVPKDQVGGEGGGEKRVYKGEAKNMYSESAAIGRAGHRARNKIKTSPADSVVTGGPENFKKIKEPPEKTEPKKKKKKGFFKRRK